MLEFGMLWIMSSSSTQMVQIVFIKVVSPSLAYATSKVAKYNIPTHKAMVAINTFA